MKTEEHRPQARILKIGAMLIDKHNNVTLMGWRFDPGVIPCYGITEKLEPTIFGYTYDELCEVMARPSEFLV